MKITDPSNPVEAWPFPILSRNRYFTGQLLDESDFTDEQNYLVGKDRLLNRTLHGWGVVTGLDVVPGEGDLEVVVGPGLAIDGWGREIVVPDPVHVDVATASGDPDDTAARHHGAHDEGWATIRIRYEESDADPIPSLDEQQAFSRIVEGYSVRTEPGLPSSPSTSIAVALTDPSVVLAAVRRASGRRGPDIVTKTYRREILSNAALLERVRALEERIARLEAKRV